MGLPFFYIFSFATHREWALYAIGTVAAIISGMAFPMLDLVYGYWLQAQAVPNPDGHHITSVARWTALTCLGLGIAQALACFVFLSTFNVASTRLASRLRHAYVQSVLYQDAEFFESVGAGEASTRIVKDMGTVKNATGEKLGFIIWGFSTLFTAVILAYIKGAKFAGVLTAIIPFGGILFAIVGLSGEAIAARIVEKEGRANTFLEQILSSIRVVQAFAAENVLIAKYDQYLHDLEVEGTKRAAVRGGEIAVSYATLYLVYATAIWWGSRLVSAGSLPVSNFFTAFWNFFNALYAIATIQPHVATVMEASIIQEHLRGVITRHPKIDVRDINGIKLDDTDNWETTIEFQSVTFAYPSRPEACALDNVSLKIDHGRVTAIVGPSGSGKSTIATLLQRWHDVDQAMADETSKKSNFSGILVGGQPINAYNLQWLRSQIAVVRQDPQLFSMSVYENVARGLQLSNEITQEERREIVREALEKAQALSFVDSLPRGMDTKVTGAKTSNLSGGQRQRLACARALIRKPKILILDEGTSALDAEVEKRLMEAVYSEQKAYGMTTILIAHRLSTIQLADNIIVMDKGRVVEEGGYKELVGLNGIFANLVARQSDPVRPNDIGDPLENHLTGVTYAVAPDVASEALAAKPMAVQYDSADEYLDRKPSQLEGNESLEVVSDRLSWREWCPRLLKYLAEHWPWFAGGTAAAFGIGVTFPIAAWLIGRVATTFSIQDDGARLRREANKWSLIFLMMDVATGVFCIFSAFFLEGGAERVSRRLRTQSLRAMVRQEVSFFDKEVTASGSLTAAVATFGASVSAILGLIWLELLASFVNLIGAVILSFVLSWKISVVSFIPLPFAILAAYLNVVVLARYQEQQMKPLEEASGFVSENVDNIQTVASLGLENEILDHFERESERNTPSKRQLYWGSLGFGIGVSFVVLVSAVVMAWGTSIYARREISLAQLSSSLEAIIVAGFSATRVFSFIPDLARAAHAFKRITVWETRTPIMQHLPRSSKFEGPDRIRGEVTFSDCSMTYDGQYRPALKGVNLHISAGQTVAFCGPSGGGKSTILALINRFYDPNSGRIEVDGIDIRAIPIADYRSCLALVSQDAVLYEGTFRENITLGIGRHVSDGELEDICTQAHILDFVKSLPDGLDTDVGLKGTKMSGGQRQRVCIARALLRNPRILLLDEATSALDAESEHHIQAALESASRGRTTICVAHRLSTIRNADVIHVVEDGQVVETGSHKELLHARGRYFNLVRSQL